MHSPLSGTGRISIFTAPTPGHRQKLAATELRRGLHQLGCSAERVLLGELPGAGFEVGELRFMLTCGRSKQETYEISAVREREAVAVTLHGSGEQALLYAVFEFLERQGAFFGLDGDLYPLDRPAMLLIPDEGRPWLGVPRFSTRGLLPWPDFLNCITVFNREDLRAYLESMLRMRLNTLGIHVYGQAEKWAESFLSFEYGGVGHNAFLDTTATDRWGYLPQRTSRFGMGAASYYDGEVFGSDTARQARDPWEAAELARELWREAFEYAEKLGIRTGVGFEPYQLPDEILRACPPEVRREHTIKWQDRETLVKRLDPESRAAREILEARLNTLLDAYPSVSHIYLWEDEFMNWASQKNHEPLPVTPFLQAHDFLRRHAPDKKLVLAGWGGVVRHFPEFHRALPEDVIFSALSDQLGWDPVHAAFAGLEGRERWPIPWLEDDPAMWFPQLHANRFERDMKLAEDYRCQGVIGIHWRHRIVDSNAGCMARNGWKDGPEPRDLYRAYARTQASGPRADDFAELLGGADEGRSLLSTWTGEVGEDSHSTVQEFAGDYNEAFTVESGLEISDELLASQAEVIATLDGLVQRAESPTESERLHYWAGQVGFLDPYARAWRTGVALHRLLEGQRARRREGNEAGAVACVRDEGVRLWIELLGHVRAAVLAFQGTVATRNDLGMLASIQNKLVRIAAFRMGASLLEFLDELPAEVEVARSEALAPDYELEAWVFVPTRPTRLAPGEQVRIAAIAPGIRELCDMAISWRSLGAASWRRERMRHIGRRTYEATLAMPLDSDLGVEYYVEATFAGNPAPVVVLAPPQGEERGYVITS